MRLGIFGGTFDPIHNVHLFIAESARRLEKLDRVLFVPAGSHQYRQPPRTNAEERCAMIAAAIESNEYFAIDETDLREDASGYTADLLPKLHARYPEAAFTFIAGADSLASNAWRRFEEVLESLEGFVIAPRAAITADTVARVLGAVPHALRARVKPFNLPEMPESATLVRTLIAQGQSVRYLVPDPVWNYITQRNLYGQSDA